MILFLSVINKLVKSDEICKKIIHYFGRALWLWSDKESGLTQLVGGEESLDLPEPEVQVLDGGDEGALPVGLLQLHGLLAGLLGEQLPLLGNTLQPVLHRLLATRALAPTGPQEKEGVLKTPGEHKLEFYMQTVPYQCFGSGSVLDPDPYWIRIRTGSGSVFGIRIRIRNPDLDPNPGGQNK